MAIPDLPSIWQHSADDLFFYIDSRLPEERILEIVEWLKHHGIEDFRSKRKAIYYWSVYFGGNPDLAMRFKLTFV